MPEYEWITDQIFTVAEFFSPEECREHIARAEAAGFDAAPINGMFGPQMRPDVRNNSRVMIDDPAAAAQLWDRIQIYVPLSIGSWRAIGVNERLRYYRYDVGQQFNWHYDGAFERSNGERSQLTFMVYLNDGFEGGETSFENAIVVPRQGMALVFVHQIRHKGQPVVRGRKYALRTDVMYRRES
jgi:prolyl 4-hydroxylase